MNHRLSGVIITILVLSLVVTSFNIHGVLADEEPNNGSSEAELIGEGTFLGNLSTSDTDDWYEVNIPACKAVLIVFQSDLVSNITLRLDDYYKWTLDEKTSVNGSQKYIFYDGERTSTYTVYLHFLGNGNYTFSVEFRPSRKCNTIVSDGYEVTETIRVSEEDRWFEMDAEDGKQINVSITADEPIVTMIEEGAYGSIHDNGTTISLKYLMNSYYDKVYVEIQSQGAGMVNITYTMKIVINTVPTPPEISWRQTTMVRYS